MKKGKIAILGAGESGTGAAILAMKEGYEVFVSDSGAIKDNFKAELDSHSIAWEENGHTTERITDADEVIKSPGIPNTAPLVKLLAAQGTPVISEIEFAARFTRAQFICITGSNGKTTTTSLIHHILKTAGLDASLAGNIGQSLAKQVAQNDHKYYVVELSSFQLDNMYRFRAHIAVLLNITPDHLDRYNHDFMQYAAAKMRITQNQTPDDYFIYWRDDATIRQLAGSLHSQATNLAFSLTDEAHILPGRDFVKWLQTPGSLLIRGKHNLYNAIAASLAAQCLGVGEGIIKRALSTFAPVEHRLETVRTINGITFVNDSKATNVDSCYYALESMTTPVVLILGGKDKGNDYSQIDNLVRQKVKTLVFMGLHNEPLRQHFGGLAIPIIDTDNIADAINGAYRAASQGDTVLLSPCCASFDLFSSYEDRGTQFKNIVNAL